MPGGGVYYRGHFCLLCVNIDHIATLREVQGGKEPDPAECAVLCEKAKCDGITVHLRQDRRHIQDRDVFALKNVIRGKFNLEIGLSDEIISVAQNVKPNQITIVPEEREEITTQGGLDIRKDATNIKHTINLFHDQNILVSLFVEPDVDAIELSKQLGADFIEIDTGPYCKAVDKAVVDKEIDRIYRAADHAVKVGMKVSAGHGLSYKNIMPVLKARALEQVNIGHSIISRSVLVGLPKAVEEMLEIMD